MKKNHKIGNILALNCFKKSVSSFTNKYIAFRNAYKNT